MASNSEFTEQLSLKDCIIGEFIDTITRFDADDNIVEVFETPLRSNIITVPVSILMAGLLKGTYVGNNCFWAVGTGSQASSPFITNLVAEYSRKQVAISFVDNTNNVTVTPTGKLVMNVSWAKGELGVVTLTEFGIFSGTNANLANGGLMMDYVPHAPLSLDSTISISRKIYFTF